MTFILFNSSRDKMQFGVCCIS